MPELAEVVREYGPLAAHVHGLTYDGTHVWFATGDKLQALDPETGRITRTLEVASDAGTAFDGHYLYQIGDDRIQKIDPATGRFVATVPALAKRGESGLHWP